jgi:hypothetical protein
MKIIALNLNDLNTPTKRDFLNEFKKKRPNKKLSIRNTLNIKTQKG